MDEEHNLCKCGKEKWYRSKKCRNCFAKRGGERVGSMIRHHKKREDPEFRKKEYDRGRIPCQVCNKNKKDKNAFSCWECYNKRRGDNKRLFALPKNHEGEKL